METAKRLVESRESEESYATMPLMKVAKKNLCDYPRSGPPRVPTHIPLNPDSKTHIDVIKSCS